jgi:hypothetical protein
MNLTLIITMIFLRLQAPVLIFGYAERMEPIRIFDPILYAFMSVESSFDKDTVNSCNAGGILQIRPEMIDEVNRILRLRKIALKYVLDDRLDSAKSVQIWNIVQGYWNPGYNLRQAAKIWNPLANSEYLKRIKKVLNTI